MIFLIHLINQNNIKYKIRKLTNICSLNFCNNISKYLLLNVILDNNKYKNIFNWYILSKLYLNMIYNNTYY